MAENSEKNFGDCFWKYFSPKIFLRQKFLRRHLFSRFKSKILKNAFLSSLTAKKSSKILAFFPLQADNRPKFYAIFEIFKILINHDIFENFKNFWVQKFLPAWPYTPWKSEPNGSKSSKFQKKSICGLIIGRNFVRFLKFSKFW